MLNLTRLVPVAGLVLLIALIPLLFVGYLAGDSVIHLIFAEHALQGDWFAFNAGEPSAGETSPGYMLIVMALLHLFGAVGAPYAMVALGVASWFALLALSFIFFNAVLGDRRWALAGVALIGFMPGSVLNSVLGMENVIFALGVMATLVVIDRFGFLSRLWPLWQELALGVALGLLSWLRPETIPFAGILLLTRLWLLASEQGWRKTFLHCCAVGLPLVILWGTMVGVYMSITHILPFGGGAARLNLALAEGFSIGGLPVHFKLAQRLGAYLPLTLAALAGIWFLFRLKEYSRAQGRTLLFCAVAAVVFAVLFSTVLPAAHLARYTIFLWPLLTLVALHGLRHTLRALQLQHPPLPVRAVVIASGILFMGSVYGYEIYLRKQMAPGHPLPEIANAPANRVAFTDALMAELNHTGSLPIAIALVEVQMRYFYDARVIIRSLDGIVDADFRKFTHHGHFHYIDYLKHRNVNYIMEYPNLNPKAAEWSPAMLYPLPTNSMVERDGLRFTRLEGLATRVEAITPHTLQNEVE